MEWWKTISWVSKDAGNAASNAATALANIQQAKERAAAEAQAEAEREYQNWAAKIEAEEERMRQAGLDAQKAAAERRAIAQLQSYGIEPTMSNINSQMNSGFTWAQQQFQVAQQKDRQDTIKSLFDTGVITISMPQEQREVLIQQALKQKQAQNALIAGNDVAAKALQAEVDYISKYNELPPLPLSAEQIGNIPPDVYQNYIKQGWKPEDIEAQRRWNVSEQLYKQAEAMAEMPELYIPQLTGTSYLESELNKYPELVEEIVQQKEAGIFPSSPLDMLPAELGEGLAQYGAAEKPWWHTKWGEFKHGWGQIKSSPPIRHLISFYPTWLEALSIHQRIEAQKDPKYAQFAQYMKPVTPEEYDYSLRYNNLSPKEKLVPPDDVLEAYDKATTKADKIIFDLMNPYWWLLFSGAAQGARVGLAGISALLAARAAGAGTVLGKILPIVGKAGVETVRAGLLPIELSNRAFALPFEGMAQGVAKIQAARLAAKWAEDVEQPFANDIAPLIAKVGNGETLTADEIAKITTWDKVYGDALAARAAKVSGVPTAKIVEEAPKAEVTLPAVETTAKEPWQMTKTDWLRQENQKLINKRLFSAINELSGAHERAVRQAISEGKPVPAEVLKDYPDLVARVSKVTPAVEAVVKAGKIPEAKIVSPRAGGTYTVTYKGKTYTGKVERIARMRSGAVLAFLENEKTGIPVSGLAKWTSAKATITPAETAVETVAKEVPVVPAAEIPQAGSIVKAISSGGKAWEPYDKLFNVEPAEETIKRLYPKDWENKMAQVVGKVPGGKTAVKVVNPLITPRETLEGTKAQEAVAVYFDRIYRRSPAVENLVEDTIRSEIPQADAIKLFQIDEQGIQHAFSPKPGFESASPAIVDVLEHPNKWQLNSAALKLSQIWNNIRQAAVRNLEEQGIKVNQKFYEEGAGYFPRMVEEAHGETIGYPRVRFEKPRVYATQLEAIDNNVVYTKDPIQNIKAFVRHTNDLIATKEFKETINAIGRTPKDVIPAEIVATRDMAVKKVADLKYIQSLVRRVGRGESILETSLKAIARRNPEYRQETENLLKLSGKERINEARKLAKTLQSKLNTARIEALKAKADYAKALDIARSPRLGEFERGTKHPIFRGRIFPQEVAQVLDQFSATRPDLVWRATQTTSSSLRTMVAAMDFSPMDIQGLPTLGRFPDKWAKTTKEAFDVLFKPENASKYLSKTENAAIRLRHPDILQGTFEYYEALPTLGKIPVVGKVISKVYSPFERFFTYWGDSARLEIAKALEPSFIKAGEAEKLGTYVNRMTGVMESRALGISSTQRAVENSFVFFAPRYTRACMAYIGNVFKGGIVGSEARRSLGQLAAGGAIFYAATCKALGQEPHFNPRYPTFMTIRIGNRNVGFGSFYYAFLRFTADVVANAGGIDEDKPQNFLSLSRRDNPFIKFMYNRAAPLTGLGVEAIERRDFMGQPFETPQDWAYWLFVQHLTPIALQSVIPQPGEPMPSNIPATIIAEEFGLRTFPQDPYFDLREKYAKQVFGKSWRDLYTTDKNGRIIMSNQQEWLINGHPDLKQAYEAYRAKASARYKAEHNL